MPIRQRLAAALSVALAIVPLAACTTAPPLPSVAQGQAIAIVVVSAARVAGPPAIDNQAVGDGAVAGAGSGVLFGGLWGLSCGPLAVVCVPAMMLTGAGMGSAAGAVVGLNGALSDDKVARLQQRVARVRAAHDLVSELRAEVTQRASRHFVVAAGGAAATTLTLDLQDLRLTTTRDERIRLTLVVRATLQAGDGNGVPGAAARLKVYEYVGPYASLASWLDEQGGVLETTLTGATRQIAAEVVAELVPR